MNFTKIVLAFVLACAVVSSAAAEWQERKDGNVVIIGPAPKTAAEIAVERAKKEVRRAKQELQRAQADQEERWARYCDWHQQRFGRRGYEPPKGCP